ncbi:Tricorn protease [Acaryochloris thomasi RCC1774]|uniref:Tricorn protease n=1 Tax=Acaryochloris thomasi RCC1774 TaxID=1764569 RepID=A0A2W1JQJ2_9CYAN|nr:S41 family peptidase [Acaryochloris thomasi]PZD72394.1 Tricorn protease [Acaryochloris thomasi RCC1774]
MQKLNRMHHIRLIFIALMSAFILLLSGALLPTAGQTQIDTFEQVWETVNDHFFDPNFNGVNWKDIRKKYKSQAKQAQSQSELAPIINQMLSELQTSHTHFYIPDDPKYYQLAGVFLPRSSKLQQKLRPFLADDKPQYSGIGIFTQQQNGNIFISGILDGSPASNVDLRVGDRILSVGGQPFHPIRSFADQVDQPVKILIQRTPTVDSQIEVTVKPKLFDGITMFLDAMDASIQVIEQAGQKIGYVHIWSYAGDQFQEKLEEELFYGRLKNTDAFILDVRDGWGGASPEYLNIYNPRNIPLTGSSRNRPSSTWNSAWSKPVVLLVNEGSRSGKEILAYGFRKHGIGPVVGARTTGAVVAGTLFAMEDGSLLYVAVQDIYLDGDQRLEGVGVAPDIDVPFSVPYAQGTDPQKDRAIEAVLEVVGQSQ